jgi:hypothetical protein
MGWLHRCRGTVVAVSHFNVANAKAVMASDELPVGPHTRVLCRCDTCGEHFVTTYPGQWTVEQMRERPSSAA